MRTQNVRFVGELSTDEENPPALYIAWQLQEGLGQCGWEMGTPGIRLDQGWTVKCCQPPGELDISVFHRLGESECLLTIAPRHVPNWFERKLLGSTASASAADLTAAARAVHRLLSKHGYHDFRWSWDIDPRLGSASAEPLDWDDAAHH